MCIGRRTVYSLAFLMIDMDVIGRPGGFARAKKLSPERRVEIAREAAKKRWAMPRKIKKKAKKKKAKK